MFFLALFACFASIICNSRSIRVPTRAHTGTKYRHYLRPIHLFLLIFMRTTYFLTYLFFSVFSNWWWYFFLRSATTLSYTLRDPTGPLAPCVCIKIIWHSTEVVLFRAKVVHLNLYWEYQNGTWSNNCWLTCIGVLWFTKSLRLAWRSKDLIFVAPGAMPV